MPIKTPSFWYRQPSSPRPLAEALLTPFSSIYQIGHRLNLSSYKTQAVPVPVICIGNATAGGSGKTPTAIAISHIIKTNNLFQTPYFLTRGYGASDKTTRIISGHETAHETGDEPQILAKHCKTIISVNRYDGAKMAHDDDADCIIMDDGLQNMSLKKDVSLLVIDGAVGFGNLKTLPAGPLREPATEALSRTDAIVMIGDDKTSILEQFSIQKPVFKAKIIPMQKHTSNKKYIGFAGLGRPEKFKNTLINAKLDMISFNSFADHHPYSEGDIKNLIAEANLKNATLITTEKDMHRIPKTFHDHIAEFKISLVFDDEALVASFLKNSTKCDKDR